MTTPARLRRSPATRYRAAWEASPHQQPRQVPARCRDLHFRSSGVEQAAGKEDATLKGASVMSKTIVVTAALPPASAPARPEARRGDRATCPPRPWVRIGGLAG